MHARLEPNHIAAMINAYGCILKDLDKAIAFFDRVPMLSSEPSVRRHGVSKR